MRPERQRSTGLPIAKIAAKLAIGYTLVEVDNDITGQTGPARRNAKGSGKRHGRGTATGKGGAPIVRCGLRASGIGVGRGQGGEFGIAAGGR